ncbi:hypothetical protein CISIN_1g012264mg [Citrus sinensis]|uniref:IST1-like protein n=1 Tax=Citrus sinensis TaxID=2711 RepID=A0A067FZ48_CITSI|nr:hypothetical protein CISIN_1g012264mg [Citrus sinensis]
MTLSVARTMKLSIFLFFKKFNSSKCKTAAKMAVARIKLLRNKREAVVRQMRRDIALLLQSKQDATARIRVEHVIREQNVLAANEFIELFCELIVARLSIIAKRRECPADLKEGIASVIFAAPRCSEIPELGAIRDIFEKKYGKDFVSAATDLRPNSGVNRMLIEKLSVRTPTGEVKLKVMKEIAKEFQIDWDTTESEMELLKPAEERIGGPDTFFSASSLPVKHVPVQSVEQNRPHTRSVVSNRERGTMQFEDTASAAEAAADSAKKAVAAAQAAAYLASRDSKQFTQAFGNFHMSQSSYGSHYLSHEEKRPTDVGSGNFHRRNSYNASSANSDIKFDVCDHDQDNKMEGPPGGKVLRRHSYNAPTAHSDIQWDESDYDEEIEVEAPSGCTSLPPERTPPPIPPSLGKQGSFHRVHPKLPDYEDLAARFEALKYRK